jgi:hypothetical protein
MGVGRPHRTVFGHPAFFPACLLALPPLLGGIETSGQTPSLPPPLPVEIVLETPRDGERFHLHAGDRLRVAGRVEGLHEAVTLEVCGQPAAIGPDGRFGAEVEPAAGENRITAVAREAGEERAAAAATVVVETACPAPPADDASRTVAAYTGAGGRAIRLNARTTAMLETAGRFYSGPGSLAPHGVTQGSYSTAIAASAGTHDGGGVIDLSVRDPASPGGFLPDDEVERMVRALRSAGFAAWYRRPPLFSRHIHAIAVGDPDLSPSAREQLTGPHGYFRGRDGLRGSGLDGHGGPRVCEWMRVEGHIRHPVASDQSPVDEHGGGR